MERSTTKGDIEQALDSSYPVSIADFSQTQQKLHSSLVQHNEPLRDVNCARPPNSPQSGNEPFNNDNDLPPTTATSSKPPFTANELSTTEEARDKSEASKDSTEVHAIYDNKIGWVYNKEYFKDLVQRSTDVETLPPFNLEREDSDLGNVDEKANLYRPIRLYESARRNGQITTGDVIGKDEGFALSFRILSKLILRHQKEELKLEMASILEEKSTSQEQITRIRSLLKDLYAAGGDDILEYEENQIRQKLLGTDEEQRSLKSNSSVSTAEQSRAQSDHPRKTEVIFGRMKRLDLLERQTGFQARFITAMLGGLALVAPMLIMAIHPNRLKTLITASVAVFLFALGVAWKSSAQRQEVLAVTAAFAAVMVVFVGVSGP